MGKGKRGIFRKLSRTKVARGAYKIARKTVRSGARSAHKRSGAIITSAFAGDSAGLRRQGSGILNDMKRTARKSTRKATRYGTTSTRGRTY